MKDEMTDRERILVNIAAMLASELNSLQMLPEVQRYMANPHSLSRIRCEWNSMGKPNFSKGDLVVCFTSTGRQQNPYLISFVDGPHPSDEGGLTLRAIGTSDLCTYGNESFIRITGIPERFIWEGQKHVMAAKINKAFAKLDNYAHRFRGLEFPEEGTSVIYVGEVWGGLGKKTKPYQIKIKYTAKTSVKGIIKQMTEQGFGTREFEADDGTYDGPMQGLATVKRDDLVNTLEAAGIELRQDVKGKD